MGTKIKHFFSMARKRLLTDGQQTVLYIVTDHWYRQQKMAENGQFVKIEL
jgi:hypothetical protein